ncbi:MAG: ATP-binding protein [Oleispira sp.]
MADLLIKHLHEKAKEHSDLENLSNQWRFDEKLIPKALQSISSLFPHYSLHDASHSRKILINIERVLGQKNIDRLTATDTWLLLEAAFLHDIGMVVPQADKNEAWSDPEFHKLVESFSQDRGNSLQRFCHMLSLQKTKSSLDLNNTGYSILEASEQFTFLMAEWFRVKHAHRATDIIQNPKASIGLNSPRTELIPKRLFKLLGAVCEIHGSNFNLLFSEKGLPFKEAGLATEDCHPRYVACLLRLGDLLDMDDNRFCPVMMEIAGENRPDVSKAHEAKHAAITHLRIDRDRIEMSSECSDIDSYLEAYNWSKWIEEEIQNQMAHWGDIVPNRSFGPLPTLGDCKVSLAGEFLVLNDGERPEFSLDQEHAIKLLQGENLYSSKFTCIRELIQNAVDSTLIRQWIEFGSGSNKIDYTTLYGEGVMESLALKNIEIEFHEEDSDSSSDEHKWMLKIQDYGTGISKEDLKYMLKISGSKRNNKRQGFINDMPEWMKPSGCFGIGFQSLFMLTDKVKLISKSIIDDEVLEIIMHNPAGDNQGVVLIKSLKKDIKIPYGCTLYIDIPFQKIPDSWSINGEYRKNAIQVLNEFDPQLSGSLPIKAATLVDSIVGYSEGLILPIKLSVHSKALSGRVELNSTTNKYHYIDVNGPILLAFNFNPSKYPSVSNTRYRGQDFDFKYKLFEYINIGFDLLSGSAEAWLKFNRKEIKADAVGELLDLLQDSLLKVIELGVDDPGKFNEMNDNPSGFSLFLKLMAEIDGKNKSSWVKLSNSYDIDWLDIKVGKYSADEILKMDTWSMMKEPSPTFNVDDGKFEENNKDDNKKVEVVYSYDKRTFVQLVASEYIKRNKGGVQVSYDSSNNEVYTYSKKAKNIVEDIDLSRSLLNKLTNNDVYSSCKRYYLYDVDGQWMDLHIDEKEIVNADNLFEFYMPGTPRVLIPHLFTAGGKIKLTPEQVSGVSAWVKPKLKKQLGVEVIESKYFLFIEYINNLMETSESGEKWKIACEEKS